MSTASLNASAALPLSGVSGVTVGADRFGCPEAGYEACMYIGIGTVVLILVILLVVYLARRA